MVCLRLEGNLVVVGGGVVVPAYRELTRTLGPSNDFTLLSGCTGKCVRLSRLLAFECTLNHCTFIHSFIHSFIRGTQELSL